MDNLDVNQVYEFFDLVTSLKDLERKGWVDRSVKQPESVADHMYAMAMMTFLLGNDSKLDRLRCMQMALVHDLAESIVGDITPNDGVSEDVKHKLEDSAMQKITSLLGDKCGSLVYDLFREYELRETPEAKFVKDLDRFDMIFTAFKYENKEGRSMQDFFNSTHGKFENEFIKKLVALLETKRNLRTSSVSEGV